MKEFQLVYLLKMSTLAILHHWQRFAVQWREIKIYINFVTDAHLEKVYLSPQLRCRPSVGEMSVICRWSVGAVTTDYLLSIGWLSTDCYQRPTIGHISTDTRLILDWYLIDRWPVLYWQSTNTWPIYWPICWPRVNQHISPPLIRHKIHFFQVAHLLYLHRFCVEWKSCNSVL